jgi:phosphomannomutase
VTDSASRAVIEQARRWQSVDPDPDSRAEIEQLIERSSGQVDDELVRRFSGRLEFGTAGLRGELGAGPMRMNRVLVRMTAAGLGRAVADAGGDRVVIGFDARHKSDVFAEDTARVLAGQGISCHLLARPGPTPVLAFAVRHLGASAGVMVTASHNPRADNGFKVYWSDGAQIVSPVDAEISDRIDAAELPVTSEMADLDDPLITVEGDEIFGEYVNAAVAVVSPDTPREISVVYTPIHGVGRDVLLAAFSAAGFPRPEVVVEQSDPDPDFPTAPFPNPEEPGVLDLAIELADTERADIVIANDPDADRLAVVVSHDGAWRTLNGNEIGCLLAEHTLAKGHGGDRIVATTVVSSRLLESMAAHHGVRYAETLTGFKWVMRASILCPDLDFVFGYEEALGYAVGDTVRDKDGVSAALAFAELAAEAKAAGLTALDRLDDLHRRHGVHHTAQRSFRFDGPNAQQSMGELMARLRRQPPAAVGHSSVLLVRDLLGPDSGLPPTDALVLELDGSTRLVLRPSGTEPKLKLYGEAVVGVVDNDLASARALARSRLGAALDAMSEMVDS